MRWVFYTHRRNTLIFCNFFSARIYLTLARQASDKAESLRHLHKALDVSKEGEDKLQQAGIAYELGRDYEAARDSETAIKVGLDFAGITGMNTDGLRVGSRISTRVLKVYQGRARPYKNVCMGLTFDI